MYVLVDENKLNELSETQNKIIELINNSLTQRNIGSNKKSSFFTVSEASKYLNISEVFIRKKIEKKELKIIRVGKAIRIKKEELEKFIKD